MLSRGRAGKRRIAIVHPWFIVNGGGEKVVEAIAELYPDADLFTLILDRKTLAPSLRNRNITASFLTSIPRAGRFYQQLVPLYAAATTALDLREYDLIISSGGPATKGVIVNQDAYHLHYCHSPVRFLWDQFPAWYMRAPQMSRLLFGLAAHGNREWDFNSAQRVDTFIANSQFVAQRIHTYYRRASSVIYPPVDVSRGYISHKYDDYFICVSRLVPGKRIDLLIHACNLMQKRLLIVGGGPERDALGAIAADTITFAGRVDDATLATLYAGARAFLFSAEEDFGIAPVEAQSYGLPVIAYGKGGVAETVIDARAHLHTAPTGVLYQEQSVNCICDAIRSFEILENSFDRHAIREHARSFDTSVFKDNLRCAVDRALEENSEHNYLSAAAQSGGAGMFQ